MSHTSFDRLLIKADQSARQGKWEQTCLLLEKAYQIDQQHGGVLTGLGSAWIQLGDIEKAIAYFQKAVKLKPNSAEAHNNLGVGYLLAEKYDQAINAYQKALALDPENQTAWKNLALVSLRLEKFNEGVEILAALIQANPDDGEALSILAECYEQAGDLSSANIMYERVLLKDPQNNPAKAALERIRLSIQPETRIAHPEHAKKLAVIKGLKSTSHTPDPESNGRGEQKERLVKVAFYGPPLASVETRLAPIVQALAAKGHKIKVSIRFQSNDLNEYDTFLFSHPHTDIALLESLRKCSKFGKRVIVDLDHDFGNVPQSYTGDAQLNPINQIALDQLDECLELASAITVTSANLAARYKKYSEKIKVIPYTWNDSNRLWSKPGPPRKTLNLGLIATHTHPIDVNIIGNSLFRILEEYPQALLGIGFGMALYQTFTDIPEGRKLFLPAGRLDDYPFLLANFDILLFPLVDHPYNLTRPDLPLMEAGVRKIPWVATPIPTYRAWGKGGLFCQTAQEWYESISELITNPTLRKRLGEEGKKVAVQRETNQFLMEWTRSLAALELAEV